MTKLAKFILLFFLLLAISLAAAVGYVQHKLTNLPITNLKYHIDSISFRHIQLSQLSLTLLQPQLDIQFEKVTLHWQWLSGLTPKVDIIEFKQGHLNLKQWPQNKDIATKEAGNDNTFQLPKDWTWPAALPNTIKLTQIQLQIPCAQQQCGYYLTAELSNKTNLLNYQIQLADNTQQPRAKLSGQIQLQQASAKLSSELIVDNSISLVLEQSLSQQPDTLLSVSNIALTAQPLSPWLVQQLQNWQIELPKPAIEQLTAPIKLDSHAELAIALPLNNAKSWQQISGQWQLNANLPNQVSLPKVGLIKGDLSSQLKLNKGQVEYYQLQTKLNLQPVPLSPFLTQYGINLAGLNVDEILIEAAADGSQQPTLAALPITVDINTLGSTQAKFHSQLIVNASENYGVKFNKTKLKLQQPKLSYPITDTEQLLVEQLAIDSEFTAHWSSNVWQLSIAKFKANAAALQLNDIYAKKVTLTLQPSTLENQEKMSINSQFKLIAASVEQPNLVPQSWQYQGSIQGPLDKLELNGRIANAVNLALTHQLTYTPEVTHIEWQLDDMFVLAGNPISASFKAWPKLLELNRGKIQANGSAKFKDNMTEIRAKINLNELSGVYDRTLFKALSSEILVSAHNDNLSIDIPLASLNEFSQGVELGPINFSGHYKAKTVDAMVGIAEIKQLTINAMGGQIAAEPTEVNLAKQQHVIKLQLDKIDLAKVLQQHPTSDLSGNGKISGTIPLLISQKGISVDQGYLAAESPGGQLQYRPAAASSMAAGNKNMKTVLNALDNFHYSVLSSNVSYDTAGKLNLALAIQGNNPNFEKGRAINFTINLEEDIPALITSMQLSSQINDTIKRRVQQRLQQKSAKDPNGESP